MNIYTQLGGQRIPVVYPNSVLRSQQLFVVVQQSNDRDRAIDGGAESFQGHVLGLPQLAGDVDIQYRGLSSMRYHCDDS